MSNFEFNKNSLIKYNGNEAIVVIPEEHNDIAITTIAENAFCECNQLTSITLLESLINIGKNAFGVCNFLATSIQLSCKRVNL